MEMLRVDLRGLPAWERTDVIATAFDRLPSSEGLMIITENEPRGLSSWFESKLRGDLMVDPRRVSDGEWHIAVRRANGRGEALTPEGILRRSPVFCDLPYATIHGLVRGATMHTARRGATIVTDNGDWPYLGIVFEGVIALASGTSAARERIYYEFFPFEVFGESEFFDRALSMGRTMVLSKIARYVRLSRSTVQSVGMDAPALLLSLGAVCAQRARLLAQSLTAQTTQPILARIASVLIPYAPPMEGLSAALVPLPNLTQAQIAASAGTVKEVAARAIAELESRALLKRERGHIRLLDRQGLIDLVRELT